MKKNIAGQVVVAQLVSKTDGSAVTTGTTSVYLSGDGGVQTLMTTGSPEAQHLGNGVWAFYPSAGETNYDHVAFTFVNSSAVNATVQIYTSYPQTGDNYARLGAPVGASISADIAGVQADTDNIQTRIPAALVSGRIDASVGAMAAGVVTAAAIATDAIDADAIAADAVTEIQSGLSTLNAAGVRSAVGLASANLDTQLSAIDDYIDTEVSAIKIVTDKLATTIESTGSPNDYVFTSQALAQAPTGGSDPWSTPLPGAYGAGTAGKIVGDNLNATVSSRAVAGDAMALTGGERTTLAGVIWATTIEGTRTAIQMMRGFASTLLSKASGMGTTTAVFRDIDDTKARVTATVDADGNRSAVTLDLT